MAKARSGTAASHEAIDRVVDADSHVIGEPLEEILPLIDDRYAVPTYVVEVDDGEILVRT